MPPKSSHDYRNSPSRGITRARERMVSALPFSRIDGDSLLDDLSDINILIIGQSLAKGLYQTTFDNSDAAAVKLKADLESYTGRTVNILGEADGATYIDQTTDPSGDAWWDDTVDPEEPALSFDNAIASVSAGGVTPTVVLFGIGESEAVRVAEGIEVGGVAKVETHFDGWEERSGLTETELHDKTKIFMDADITQLGHMREPLDYTSGDTIEFDMIMKKTVVGQYPCLRMIINEGNFYIIFNGNTGEVTRHVLTSGKSFTDAPDVGEFFGSCDADGTANVSGDWLRITASADVTATRTSYNYIYPAYSSNGTVLNSVIQIGSIIARDPSPTLANATYSVKPDVKDSYKSIFDHCRTLYGSNILTLIAPIGRRAQTIASPWNNQEGANVIRNMQIELVAENGNIKRAGEIIDYEILTPDTTNVHGTNDAYINKGAPRHARAIAAHLGYDVAWEGATVTGVSVSSDTLIIDTTPEDSAAYHADMGHNGSGVADLTPSATEIPYLMTLVDGVVILPTAVTHYDESHATTPNEMHLTYASGALAGCVVDVHYMYGFGTHDDGTTRRNVNILDVVKDVNNLPMRPTHWRKYDGGSFNKIV